jgi:hypothetical protein
MMVSVSGLLVDIINIICEDPVDHEKYRSKMVYRALESSFDHISNRIRVRDIRFSEQIMNMPLRTELIGVDRYRARYFRLGGKDPKCMFVFYPTKSIYTYTHILIRFQIVCPRNFERKPSYLGVHNKSRSVFEIADWIGSARNSRVSIVSDTIQYYMDI